MNDTPKRSKPNGWFPLNGLHFVTLLNIALLTGLLVSCASTSIIRKGEQKIQPGMTGDEVAVLFGDAEFRQAQENNEVWQYCRTGITEDEFLAVWFTSGKTTGITSYSLSQGTGICSDFFQPLPWGMAPDAPADEQVEGLQQFLLRQMQGGKRQR